VAAVDDLKSLLSLIPGGESVNQKLADFEAYIRAAAKSGAEEAIPDIQAKVEATVQPYVIAALLLGAGGLLFGLSAHMQMRRKLLHGGG